MFVRTSGNIVFSPTQAAVNVSSSLLCRPEWRLTITHFSLLSYGSSWSEYTLYRTALDHFGAFDALHAVGPTKLIGDSVWYSEDFKTWNAAAAFNGETVWQEERRNVFCKANGSPAHLTLISCSRLKLRYDRVLAFSM